MPPLRDRGNDIVLLFRLFAMQMGEKYHLPKITLTEDAKQLLLHYKWPGNVRQLKNITEQMSVLSENREISAEDLKKFIPEDPESTQLATISTPGQYSYENEREVLYKILYELKGNVADLRRDMTSLRKQFDEARQLSGAAAYNSNFIDADSTQLPAITPSAPIQHYASLSPEEAEAEEIKGEPESLNLSDLGRQMVEKALERNGGNRKKAAQELGISDRTLYRRIKQYGLEKDK
jgi:sigma-54 dependent transcriptional regulator